MKARKYGKWLLIASITLIVIYLIFNYNKIPGHITRADLVALNTHDKFLGSVALWVVMFISALIPGLPTSAFETFVGVCAGPVVGIIISWSGCVLAQLTLLKIIQLISAKQISFMDKLKDNKVLEKLRALHHPIIGLALAYVNPVFPPTLVTICLSEQKISIKQKLLCICLGFIPSAVILSIGGDAIIHGNWQKILIVIVILVVVVVLFELIHRLEKRL